MKEYIKEQVTVLKELCIWSKMSPSEKREFKSRTTEISVDNAKRDYIHKYL